MCSVGAGKLFRSILCYNSNHTWHLIIFFLCVPLVNVSMFICLLLFLIPLKFPLTVWFTSVFSSHSHRIHCLFFYGFYVCCPASSLRNISVLDDKRLGVGVVRQDKSNLHMSDCMWVNSFKKIRHICPQNAKASVEKWNIFSIISKINM